MAVLSSLSHVHLLAQGQAKPCAFLSPSSPHSSSSLSSLQDSHLKLPTITHHPSPHSGLSSRRSCSRPGIAIYAAVTQRSLHDFSVKDIDGKNVDLSTYKGKVLLIVNVASRCGLTASNYTELAKLYSNFKGRDFEILAFPCNQFGGQEPGSNRQIKEFACSRFKSEFPIFDKVDVNGPNEAPVYKFLKSNKPGGLIEGLLGDGIKWNFEKFLVDKKGRVFERYPPTTSPLQIEGDIKKLLAT